MSRTRYRGRFAPSPSGPLHFGSLVAAVASYADARHHHGDWLIRIEDVDETRTRPGAETSILHALTAFGMHADEPPLRQSERKPLYGQALDRLLADDRIYRCSCSRRKIAMIATIGPEGPVYPRTCRRQPPPADAPAALRIEVPAGIITFDDRVVGPVTQDVAQEIGDFVVRRLDGFTAYQLAVVVDDADQGITDIVRGADLLWSTPRQLWLQRLLGFPEPRYAHVPLALDASGRKLSKRDAAHPLDDDDPLPALRAAWQHLGQATPTTSPDSVDAFWRWAIPHWRMDRVPNGKARQA
ncbi:MAG: tRNA glutamyl-Q(34) synthetase GluQRS [Gammaproteobacteria bacterium]|nr:tRNA glutamyl-Q(34) synthetase GluQRS [Gammaproteobacteria bacterium]